MTLLRGTLAAIDGDKSLDIVIHAGDMSYADCDQVRGMLLIRSTPVVYQHHLKHHVHYL